MLYVCVEFIGVPNPHTHRTEFDNDPLIKIFRADNIKKFNQDFIGLTEDDIKGLMVPANATTGDPTYPIPLLYKRRMLIILSMFHDMSREAKGIIDIATVTRAEYDEYRTSLYTAEPIIPWNSPKKAVYSVQADELNNWMKQVKPNRADYKEFRDETHWLKNEDRVKGSLQSSALEHLIEVGYVPSNPELDLAQRKWLMKIFVDTQTAPMAKTILKKYSSTWDTRGAWEEIEEFYSTSMTTQFSTQRLSTYITSTRLANIDWRGTHENFIIHYKEQARLYNEQSDEEYTDGQLIGFLEAALIGVPHFSQVKVNYETSRRAAGLLRHGVKLTFAEYIGLLISQAQTYDAGNKTTKNPRSHTRQVNMSELVFEDDIYDDEHGTLEAAIHDMDTTLDQLEIMQNEGTRSDTRNGAPRKARMNLKTWNSLSPADQKAWDLITDGGKNVIILYSSTRGTDGNDKKAKQYSVNNHTITFDEDKEKLEDVHEEEDPKIEIGMHQVKDVDKNTSSSSHTLLHMATNKTNLKDVLTQKTALKKGPHHNGLDINYMLSQPSISNGATSKTKSQTVAFSHEMLFTRGDLENDTSDDDTFDREEARERDLKEQGMDSPSEAFSHEVNVHEWDDFLDSHKVPEVREDNDSIQKKVKKKPSSNELDIDQVNDFYELMGIEKIPIKSLPIEERKETAIERIPKKPRTVQETDEEALMHYAYASETNMSGKFDQVPKPQETMLKRLKMDADKQGHTYYSEVSGQVVSSSSKTSIHKELPKETVSNDTNVMTSEPDPQEPEDKCDTAPEDDHDFLQALEMMQYMGISERMKNDATKQVSSSQTVQGTSSSAVTSEPIQGTDATEQNAVLTKNDTTEQNAARTKNDSNEQDAALTKDESVDKKTSPETVATNTTEKGTTQTSPVKQVTSYAEKVSAPANSPPQVTSTTSDISSINSKTPPDPYKDPNAAAKLAAFKAATENGTIFDSDDHSSLSSVPLGKPPSKQEDEQDDFTKVEISPNRKARRRGKNRKKNSVLDALGNVIGIGSPRGYMPVQPPSSNESSPDSANQFASFNEDDEQLDNDHQPDGIPSIPQQESGPDFHQAGSK